MKIHRSEIETLSSWLNKAGRKPLILRGARQVGKSTLIRELALHNNKTCLELNFEKNPEHADFFKSKTPNTILKLLSLFFNQKITPQSSILFLDEIQATPEVIETLRYFFEEFPELPVIAAGSLLDFVLSEPEFSIPVGRVEYFYLGPISFEDFLRSQGETNLLEWIQSFNLNDEVPEPLHQRCLQLVKEFWLIGGMPEIVAKYAKNKDFFEIDNLKQNIIQGYEEDFHKYSRVKKISLLRRVYKTIPNLIGQKIKYNQLDPDSKALKIKEVLEYLDLAKVIHLIYHSHSTGLPLKSQIDHKIFKSIFIDIGLLSSALGLSHLSILHAPDWAWINRGSLSEQFVGQTLLQLSPPYKKPELYYWVREQAQSSAELDYVWQYENQIIPIEVKAGKTGRLKSLHYFIKEKNWSFGVRFNTDIPSILHETTKLPKQAEISYRLLSLPFYLTGQLNRLLKPFFFD
ncbi:MAG: ATP-binding protein [Alphaproteobacteria bacterium]|nr:ATP-binding protein [Alphaproteobacteria bacterium]